MSQVNLSKTIFPLGNFIKNEVKNFAKFKNLDFLLNKSESYEICFIPYNNYRLFLNNKITNSNYKISSGEFILTDGTIIGYHEGYPFYTIGQRKGISIFLGYPFYVISINKKNNKVTLGKFEELSRIGIYINKVNMLKYFSLNNKINAVTQIRYNDIGVFSIINKIEGNKIKIRFFKKVYALMFGQSSVFYEKNDIIGGGFIFSSF